ncbi:RICIN domain-containing protein [Ruminiclostridium josui]|uniref:RICIN domain-containing protein n=1 Tax=Ruminiclostridium josui TaxID=1499 RepID=UPI0004B6B967|nr:RICIN domain-containing protein [Ruminiclostridium josui]
MKIKGLIVTFTLLLAVVFNSGISLTVGTASGNSLIYGDYNGDGNINALDLAGFKQYLMDSERTYNSSMDLNLDNAADSVDYAILKQYLLGIVTTLPINAPVSNIKTGVNYKIINRNSGKLLDVSGASVADGGNVIQWGLTGGTNQQWSFADAGGGYYKIVNRNSGKLLEILNSSTENGGDAIQGTDSGSDSQKWRLIDIGGGYYKIVNMRSGKLLDVLSVSTANGGDVAQWTDNGGKNQQWYLVPQTTGNITYTLVREQNPTADQADAYAKIKAAMDSAVLYYNNLTNISKQLTVYYNPSVSTADGSINGTIRFGASRSYMDTCTAMHEIAHTVGVGQSSAWYSLVKNGIYTGIYGTEELRNITGVSTDVVHGDSQHFWPYGLNYSSEVKTDADYVNHCRIVNQFKKDGV